MKASQFISTLRKIIREEVNIAVKQQLKEHFGQSSKNNTTKTSNKYNTGNSMLDELLSETVLSKDFVGESEMGNMFNVSATDITDTGQGYQSNLHGDPTSKFVKDYSAVLKKADQIAKGGR